MADALKTCAVKPAGLPEDTSSHDLRHFYASALVNAGVDVFTVSRWLGHQDPSLVIKLYGHMQADQEARTRQVVDSLWNVTTVCPSQPVKR